MLQAEMQKKQNSHAEVRGKRVPGWCPVIADGPA